MRVTFCRPRCLRCRHIGAFLVSWYPSAASAPCPLENSLHVCTGNLLHLLTRLIMRSPLIALRLVRFCLYTKPGSVCTLCPSSVFLSYRPFWWTGSKQVQSQFNLFYDPDQFRPEGSQSTAMGTRNGLVTLTSVCPLSTLAYCVILWQITAPPFLFHPQ